MGHTRELAAIPRPMLSETAVWPALTRIVLGAPRSAPQPGVGANAWRTAHVAVRRQARRNTLPIAYMLGGGATARIGQSP